MDVYPTLVDIVGLPRQPANEGKSLKKIIETPENPPDFPQIAYTQVSSFFDSLFFFGKPVFFLVKN